MVMDSTPSPQNVGREFVRQYYTLLNKAPNHLHRFYNNHSSFIHGGLDIHNRETTLVVGQKNIHSKIQQLNFRDCHAKISQVDAQATLGNGVVVQVTGELSNDGQPMRRFTQTFVLAAQSPKNYYVHNDIFRYQDLYLEDDLESGETRLENDDDQSKTNSTMGQTNILLNSSGQTAIVSASGNVSISEQQSQPLINSVESGVSCPATPQQIFYAVPLPQAVVKPFNAGVTPLVTSPTGQITSAVSGQLITSQSQQQSLTTQVNGVHEELLQTIQQSANASPAVSALVDSSVPQINPSNPILLTQQDKIILSTEPTSIVTVPSFQTAILQNSNCSNVSSTTIAHKKNNTSENNIQSEKRDSSPCGIESNKKDENKSNQQTQKYDVKPVSNQSEIKTYANLFKSGNSFSNSGFVPLPQPTHQVSSQIYSKSIETTRPENNSLQSPATSQQRTNIIKQTKDYTEKRTNNANSFADSHQLFLGNVPHCATEEDLKALFGQFGTVVDLRIHSKPGTKLPGQRNTQNYGFITYENLEDVQTCLLNCPLFFPAENGQKLNVEEKKTRPRNEVSNRQQNNILSSGGLNSSQRSTGNTAPNRSHSNPSGLMRSGNVGQRTTGCGGFNRNENRVPLQSRNSSGQTNQSSLTSSGGGSFTRR